jgi:hypothetical protein
MAIKSFFILVVTSTLAMAVAAASAGDWTQFRGPGGLGASDETNLPVSWSEDENLAWKLALPGYGASSPITIGDHIYVTCYSGYGLDRSDPGNMDDLMLHLVCVNRADGKIVFDEKIKPNLPESNRVRDHGYAAPTIASDGKHLFVFFGKTGVFKFDLDGKQIWQADVGSRTHGWGCGTSPVLYKNLVIVNASVESSALVALKQDSGEEVWRAPGMKSSWNTPHLVDVGDRKQELVVSVKGSILAFDPDTGKPLWNCHGIQDYVCPSIISHQGVIYAIGGRTSRCIAVRAGGRGNVTESHRLWEAKAGANVCSPVIYKDHLYWVSDRNRVAYCVRMKDGEVLHSERFPAQPYASALLADGKLYIVSRYDGTFVLEATPEMKQLAHNKFDDDSTFNASPIASGGKVLIRSDKFLYCVGK